MSVPRHVLEAEKRLEEAMKAQENGNTADEATPEVADLPEKDTENAVSSQENTTPEDNTPAQESETLSAEEQLQKALHKVSVLEGKLRSLDTRELQSRLSRIEHERDQYKQAADALFTEVRDLKLQGTAQPAPKAEAADPLTDEQKEIYGDLIPVMTAVVNKALAEKGVEPVKSSQIEEIGRQVQQVRAEFGQERQRSARESFFAKIDAMIPDREALEKSPDFAAFMEERDWKTGVRNQDLLIARGQAFDAEGAAAFYREFKKSIGKDDAADETPKRDPREKYLSPGKARASAPASRKGPLTSAEAGRMIAEAKTLLSKGDHAGAEKINNELIKRMSAA